MDNIRVDNVRVADRVWFKAELMKVDEAINITFKCISGSYFALVNFPQGPVITEAYLIRKSKAIKGIYSTIEALRDKQFNT